MSLRSGYIGKIPIYRGEILLGLTQSLLLLRKIPIDRETSQQTPGFLYLGRTFLCLAKCHSPVEYEKILFCFYLRKVWSVLYAIL